MEFWFPLIGMPIGAREIIILGLSIVLFSLAEKPQKLVLAAFYAWVGSLIITIALPYISDSGIFDFKGFTQTLMERNLGEMMFRFGLLFAGIYLARRAVKEFGLKQVFFKK